MHKGILTIFFTVSFTGTGAWTKRIHIYDKNNLIGFHSGQIQLIVKDKVKDHRSRTNMIQPLGSCTPNRLHSPLQPFCRFSASQWNYSCFSLQQQAALKLSVDASPFPSLNFLPRPSLGNSLTSPLICVNWNNCAMPKGDMTWPPNRQGQRQWQWQWQCQRQRQWQWPRQRQTRVKCLAAPLFNCVMTPPGEIDMRVFHYTFPFHLMITICHSIELFSFKFKITFRHSIIFVDNNLQWIPFKIRIFLQILFRFSILFASLDLS